MSLNGPRWKRLVVGVAGHLVVAREQLRVGLDDAGDLQEDVLAVLLQRLAAGVEEHVAGQRDDHAVVADVHGETELGELVELALELLESLLDELELVRARLVLLEGLLPLGEVRLRRRDLHPEVLELAGEVIELGLGLAELRVVVGLQLVVLGELRLPLVLRVAATARTESREGREEEDAEGGEKSHDADDKGRSVALERGTCSGLGGAGRWDGRSPPQEYRAGAVLARRR